MERIYWRGRFWAWSERMKEWWMLRVKIMTRIVWQVNQEVNRDRTGEADENESGSLFQRLDDAYLNKRSVIFKKVGGRERVKLVWTDTAKFTDMIVARFRKCRDLVREGKMFVKNKADVSSGVGCSERAVVYLRKLLFKSNKVVRSMTYLLRRSTVAYRIVRILRINWGII